VERAHVQAEPVHEHDREVLRAGVDSRSPRAGRCRPA
jgi:hypothetical protein